MTDPNPWTSFAKTVSCTESFLQKCMIFQKTAEATTEVISKLEKKQICLESCTKKYSFIILPSYDFVERQLYNLVHSSDKVMHTKKTFLHPKANFCA